MYLAFHPSRRTNLLKIIHLCIFLTFLSTLLIAVARTHLHLNTPIYYANHYYGTNRVPTHYRAAPKTV